jgi:hypothetical protein
MNSRRIGKEGIIPMNGTIVVLDGDVTQKEKFNSIPNMGSRSIGITLLQIIFAFVSKSTS